jgi:prolyl-tRNA synthetase
MYSFSKNEKEHAEFYEEAIEAYKNIFNRIGIGEKTYLTYASGGTFSKYSHEFQTICEAGEDTIYISDNDYGKGLEMTKGHAALNPKAFNKEIWTDELKNDLKEKGSFREIKAIEVGNIFTLGTRFSEPFDLNYVDEDGNKQFVFMGSYGIGLSRLMGSIVEVSHDERGIIWPANVAPFDFHLISLGKDQEADKIYSDLKAAGFDVLYDDRIDKSAGEKFSDADLIGCPVRLVVSQKTDGKVEVKKRSEKDSQVVDPSILLELLK